LLKNYAERLDDRGRDYLSRIRGSAQRLAQLIDDLLNLSRLGRQEMHKETIDLTALACRIMEELKRSEPARAVEFAAQPGLTAHGDPNLIKIALENLLGNAWKYTARREKATVEFGATRDKQTVYFVRDNGAGFDMAFADKLFIPFQRLHSPTQFPGSGIGLATVKRIVQRHGGDVWGHSDIERGATFFFTLDNPGEQ
jgi:signal transduction histidine kinase